MTIQFKESELRAMGITPGGKGGNVLEVVMTPGNKPNVIVPRGASTFGSVHGPFRLSIWIKPAASTSTGNADRPILE